MTTRHAPRPHVAETHPPRPAARDRHDEQAGLRRASYPCECDRAAVRREGRSHVGLVLLRRESQAALLERLDGEQEDAETVGRRLGRERQELSVVGPVEATSLLPGQERAISGLELPLGATQGRNGEYSWLTARTAQERDVAAVGRPG